MLLFKIRHLVTSKVHSASVPLGTHHDPHHHHQGFILILLGLIPRFGQLWGGGTPFEENLSLFFCSGRSLRGL